VKRDTLPGIKAQVIAVQIWAFEGEDGAVLLWLDCNVEKVDHFGFHIDPPRNKEG
jgi:hypothetical protein